MHQRCHSDHGAGTPVPTAATCRLVALRPQWLGVLALPVGYMTFFDADRLQTIVDADDRQVYPALDGGDG